MFGIDERVVRGRDRDGIGIVMGVDGIGMDGRCIKSLERHSIVEREGFRVLLFKSLRNKG